MIKRPVLGRYEQVESGQYLIDVSANKVESLYNNFDKSSPFIKRDLEQDLVDYLIESARELGRCSYAIRLRFEEPCEASGLSRVQQSVKGYFQYLAHLEKLKIKRLFGQSMVMLMVGMAILFLSVSLHQAIGESPGVMAGVVAEGLTIAAWVAIWEALALLLVELFPCLKNIRLFQRISSAPVELV